MTFNIFRIIIILLVSLFQYSFLNFVFPDFSTPNIMWMVVISYVIVQGLGSSWVWIIFLGVFADLFSFSFLGKHVFIFILGAYLVSLLLHMLVIERRGGLRIFVFFALSFCVTVFYNLLELIWPENRLIFSNLIQIGNNFGFFVKSVIFQSLGNTILLYFFYGFIDKLEKKAKFYGKKSID